jgi:hypothetical protein
VTAQASHSTTLASADIVIPVPVSIARRPARRTAAASSASPAAGTSASRAERSMVYGSTAARSASPPMARSASTPASAPPRSSSRTRYARIAWSVPGRGARWRVASRAVSVRLGSITHTSARSLRERMTVVGLGIPAEWPCETTGFTPR